MLQDQKRNPTFEVKTAQRISQMNTLVKFKILLNLKLLKFY